MGCIKSSLWCAYEADEKLWTEKLKKRAEELHQTIYQSWLSNCRSYTKEDKCVNDGKRVAVWNKGTDLAECKYLFWRGGDSMQENTVWGT